MRIKIAGTYQEFAEKSEDVIKALAENLYPINPDIAEILEKAIPRKESGIHLKVVKDIKAKADQEYSVMLERMKADIGKVLDRSVAKKSDSDDEIYDYTQRLKEIDSQKYDLVKKQVKKLGYDDKAFDKGGKFYGWSTNELIDWLRNESDSTGRGNQGSKIE